MGRPKIVHAPPAPSPVAAGPTGATGPTEEQLRQRRFEERAYQESLRRQMRAEAKADELERRAYEEEQAKKTAQLRLSQELLMDRQKEAQSRNLSSNLQKRQTARGSQFTNIAGNLQIPGGSGTTYN